MPLKQVQPRIREKTQELENKKIVKEWKTLIFNEVLVELKKDRVRILDSTKVDKNSYFLLIREIGFLPV